jgi:hypothetical protein
VPCRSALTQARQRLGPRPVAALFRRLAGPAAAPGTPGAFLFGLRLMALDGTTLDLPDTPADPDASAVRRWRNRNAVPPAPERLCDRRRRRRQLGGWIQPVRTGRG